MGGLKERGRFLTFFPERGGLIEDLRYVFMSRSNKSLPDLSHDMENNWATTSFHHSLRLENAWKKTNEFYIQFTGPNRL